MTSPSRSGPSQTWGYLLLLPSLHSYPLLHKSTLIFFFMKDFSPTLSTYSVGVDVEARPQPSTWSVPWHRNCFSDGCLTCLRLVRMRLRLKRDFFSKDNPQQGWRKPGAGVSYHVPHWGKKGQNKGEQSSEVKEVNPNDSAWTRWFSPTWQCSFIHASQRGPFCLSSFHRVLPLHQEIHDVCIECQHCGLHLLTKKLQQVWQIWWSPKQLLVPSFSSMFLD